MSFTTPPPIPQSGDSRFSAQVDAFVRWLIALVPQLASFLSSLTTMAAGGANTFSYTFDTATADADPTTGKMRLGSATQNGAVVMRLDDQAASGGSIAAFLTALQAGTSNIKGSVRLQKVGDPSAWLLFDITNIAAATGYRNLTVIPRGGSAASPFVNDETLSVFFDQKGDKGDSGGTPTQAEILAAVGTLPITSGGTGATTAATARANLGVKATGTEPITSGGTGATTATQALVNLGAMPKAGGVFTGPVVFAEGSPNAPSITFTNDPSDDTGFYHIADGQIGVVCNGVVVARFTPAGLEVIRVVQTAP